MFIVCNFEIYLIRYLHLQDIVYQVIMTFIYIINSFITNIYFFSNLLAGNIQNLLGN